MKVCRICQEDCSAKARVRDPEGHYYCKACFEELKAGPAPKPASRAPAAAALGVGGEDAGFDAVGEDPGLGIESEGYGLADLMEDAGAAEEGSTMCPECGWAIRAGAALCVHCGYDPVKGKSLKTAVKGPECDPLEVEYAAKRARAASSAAMTPVRMILASAIGGVVVIAGWTLIAYKIQGEFTYMAAIAGVVVGGATIKGARGDSGPLVGLTAALVTLVAIFGGRFGAVSMLVDDDIKALQSTLVEEETVLLFLAEDVADQWEKEGRKIDWPLGLRPESIDDESDCPPDLWDATLKRWAGMSPTEQQNYTYRVDDTLNAMLSASASYAKEEMFAENFSIFFLAMLAIGVGVAFSMGMWGDDLPV